MQEVNNVSGASPILVLSSAVGHLFRAFSFGYAVGTFIYNYETPTQYADDLGAGAWG